MKVVIKEIDHSKRQGFAHTGGLVRRRGYRCQYIRTSGWTYKFNVGYEMKKQPRCTRAGQFELNGFRFCKQHTGEMLLRLHLHEQNKEG